MDFNILLGASCPFAGLTNNDFNSGFFTGIAVFGIVSLGVVLIRIFIKRNSKKPQAPDNKKILEANTKIAELSKALSEAKDQSSKSFEAGALYSLVLLQREGRFVDFIQENIKNYEDSQIGAAVRQIHAGCSKVLSENFNIKALYDKNNEGDKITISESFNAEEVRLSGNVPSKGPYKGILRHKGWTSALISMAKKTAKTSSMVVCPAEIEIE